MLRVVVLLHNIYYGLLRRRLLLFDFGVLSTLSAGAILGPRGEGCRKVSGEGAQGVRREDQQFRQGGAEEASGARTGPRTGQAQRQQQAVEDESQGGIYSHHHDLRLLTRLFYSSQPMKNTHFLRSHFKLSKNVRELIGRP